LPQKLGRLSSTWADVGEGCATLRRGFTGRCRSSSGNTAISRDPPVVVGALVAPLSKPSHRLHHLNAEIVLRVLDTVFSAGNRSQPWARALRRRQQRANSGSTIPESVARADFTVGPCCVNQKSLGDPVLRQTGGRLWCGLFPGVSGPAATGVCWVPGLMIPVYCGGHLFGPLVVGRGSILGKLSGRFGQVLGRIRYSPQPPKRRQP